MDDSKLFDELVKKDIISQDIADKLLKAGELSERPAEEILYEERVADEKEVAKVKSEILDVPYKDVDPESIPDEILDMVPYETSRTYKFVPIEKKDDGTLIVGMLNPKDSQAQKALRFIAQQNRVSLGVYLVTPKVLRSVWRRYVPYEDEIESAVKAVSAVGQEEEDEIGLEETVSSSEEAPIIKIVASTLRQAVDVMASDVHIEPQRKRLRIRFRVDGDLREVANLPPKLSKPIISRVKVMSKLKLDETRIPQDGRFRTTVFGRNIDFRVATFPTPTGEKVAIRVLDPTTGMKSLEELGLKDYNYEKLKEAIDDPYGMTLMTGPTSSGKTTSLYSIMNRLNTEDRNIVTLEDPVEYFIDGVNQSQVVPGIGYNFASGLRQILRQDPDVIMVGEIRDGETASLAVNAALTGHLMLSTLHTNNSVGVIPRLIDLGVPSFLLPSSLNLMVAQRLVSRLCSQCRVKTDPSDELKGLIEDEVNSLPDKIKEDIESKHGPDYKVYRSEPQEDCEECGGNGTSGRVAIFEVFKMTRRLGSIITKGNFSEDDLWKESQKQGMVTLRQDGVIKALDGDVMIEEVMRETSETNKE